jgi:hypothetical protein
MERRKAMATRDRNGNKGPQWKQGATMEIFDHNKNKEPQQGTTMTTIDHS